VELTMLVDLRLPGALRPYAGGQRAVAVTVPEPPAVTVGRLLEALGGDHPGVRQRVIDELGTLRPHVNVYVNGESVRYLRGLETPLSDGDEVTILPAVSGGA